VQAHVYSRLRIESDGKAQGGHALVPEQPNRVSGTCTWLGRTDRRMGTEKKFNIMPVSDRVVAMQRSSGLTGACIIAFNQSQCAEPRPGHVYITQNSRP
jgi:hypothetical protein